MGAYRTAILMNREKKKPGIARRFITATLLSKDS